MKALALLVGKPILSSKPSTTLACCCCSDGSGHTRFVVRGRRGASIAAVLQHAIDEVATASQAGSVPAASVEVVGEGMMEW